MSSWWSAMFWGDLVKPPESDDPGSKRDYTPDFSAEVAVAPPPPTTPGRCPLPGFPGWFYWVGAPVDQAASPPLTLGGVRGTLGPGSSGPTTRDLSNQQLKRVTTMSSDTQMTEEEYNRARPTDFDVFEDIVDCSRSYAAFLVGGKQERIPEGATFKSGKANFNAGKRVCTANIRLAHDPALPTALAACQGQLVRFEAPNNDRRYGEFCDGIGVNKVTFEPSEYAQEGRELPLRVRLFIDSYPMTMTDPESGRQTTVTRKTVKVAQAFRVE